MKRSHLHFCCPGVPKRRDNELFPAAHALNAALGMVPTPILWSNPGEDSEALILPISGSGPWTLNDAGLGHNFPLGPGLPGAQN